MYKKFFGDERLDLVNWFSSIWLDKGPNICFLEGFPGVGKSELVSEVAMRLDDNSDWIVINYEVPDRKSLPLIDVWLEIADRLARAGMGKMQEILSEEGNLAYAIETALNRKVFIILDEAQRLFELDKGIPNDQLNGVLSFLKRHSLTGRLLLLSDRLVERERWSESFAIKTLNALNIIEAEKLLNDRLGLDLIDDVPIDRKSDLLRILGCNPRAIETLVASLHYEPLEDLIGIDPGLWEVRDRNVSPEFLKKLERQLLERTLSHLDNLVQKRLTMLAVHRGSFEVAAFETACSSNRKEWRDLRYLLINRFLVRHSKAFYSLHPVVREISLARLKTNAAELQLAHSRSSDYYLRHFNAQNMVLRHEPLRLSYAELRYHLFNSDRLSELKSVAIRVADHIGKELNMSSPLPTDEGEMNEQIALLNSLLEYDGPYYLHYYLARLLMKRDSFGDVENALSHSKEAIKRGRQAELWVFLARLQEKIEGREVAINTILAAVNIVDDLKNRTILYQVGSEFFEKNNEIDEAIKFLRSGILVIPPESGLSMLYINAAKLLEQKKEISEAIILLKEGIKILPPEKNLSSLYHRLAELNFHQGNKVESFEVIELGLKNLPARDLHPLFLLKAELQKDIGNVDAAIATLINGMEIVPPENSLLLIYDKLAEVLLEEGRLEDARGIIRKGMDILGQKHGGKRLDEILEKINNLVENKIDNKKDFVKIKFNSKVVLLMATEWFSKNGGLSSFNRSLCQKLAKCGITVMCVVPEASDTEIRSAAMDDVILIQGPEGRSGDQLSGLYRKLQIPMNPDIIIGHGRITGPAAKVQVEDNFPAALRVHFVHMAPGEIEWFKGKSDAAMVADAREREEADLASTATVVAAVGPRLYREVGNLLAANIKKSNLIEFIPGCNVLAEPRPCPPQLHCLLLGRAEDIELKGLDIAARALAIASRRSSNLFEYPPELVVRGAPEGTGGALREKLKGLACDDLSIRVREYTSNESDIESDLRRASLLLMPSRKEGFGLVALEALALGTPVLVSDQSGVADLIKRYSAKSDANKIIVETAESLSSAAENWARAIEFQLTDRDASFKRAWGIGQSIAKENNWEKSIDILLHALGCKVNN